ncbi:helix-turn-helix domain-containing protein [Hymenobacter sp. BT175]|uniref:helix-turn-helix domain-containing protein n=1 Tax=Hymenobacter translucens TaxID=2886507 RepID=UPI001D0DCD87|nr:helix-turn-helix domain-containing protein [Hymenobacter translucens]MCC2545489.1 helix-turn-helix domain-containing protein [Hymenobacter translucens]
MLDSPFSAQLVQLLRQALHEEIAMAVRQALGQGLAPTTPARASDETPALLSVREAAAFLQVSVATVHAWKRRGLITYRKIGARTLFERSALLAAAAPQAPVFDGRRSAPRRKGGGR